MSNVPVLTKKLNIATRQRNLSFLFNAVFGLATISAAMLALSREDRIITIPTTVDQYVIEKGKVSDNYLMAMTRDGANLFLNRHPYDSQYFEENVLRIVHPSTHEEIKKVLANDDDNNQWRSGIRNWLPESICLVRGDMISEVRGRVETYVNGEVVSQREVIHNFKWLLDGTRLWLVSASEITKDDAKCIS